ncbi:MAG: transcription termination/antitermination factor NusG [Dehalococcoidia bacterium]|nr:transcription termination/antitermination factor NusG [Dehalococcoidia bacterium]
MSEQGNWYLHYVSSGREDRATRNLEQRVKYMDAGDKIFKVLVPTTNEIEIRGGKRRSVVRKAFPGYIMVRMDLDEESWDIVRNTPGVAGFVSTGIKPTPLVEQEANKILDRMQGTPTEVQVAFKKGDSVRVTNGPFIDFIGKVEEVNAEKGKAIVLLSLFGRETPVELDFLSVERL